MSVTMYSLFGHRHSTVKHDRSDEGLMLAANLTKHCVGIGGYVID